MAACTCSHAADRWEVHATIRDDIMDTAPPPPEWVPDDGWEIAGPWEPFAVTLATHHESERVHWRRPLKRVAPHDV